MYPNRNNGRGITSPRQLPPIEQQHQGQSAGYLLGLNSNCLQNKNSLLLIYLDFENNIRYEYNLERY